LRRLYYGASPIAEDLLLQARAVFGCQFFQLYGLTETVGAATCLPDAAHDPALGKLRACGVPYPGIEIRVVDEQGADVPSGSVGEVVIRSGVVMKGYWGRAEATAEAIRDGWFYTGDLAVFDELGILQFRSRIKELIKTGGINVTPADVEEALEEHPGVRQAIVVGVPDAQRDEIVAAMVVLPSGPTRMPVSRSIAVSRGSDSGGSISRSSTVDPVAIPSNQGRPCRSRGAWSPVAASTSRASPGDPSSHPGHETTTTSPLSNSLTNSW
jgi:acyl-CoA synthetase (AMP-forming)/AMP-acid ligase II